MITWNSSVGPETDGFQSEIIKQKLLKTQKQLTGTRQFSDVDLIEGSSGVMFPAEERAGGNNQNLLCL